MRSPRAAGTVRRILAISVLAACLIGCDSSPTVPERPGTVAAITLAEPDLLEFAGGDIFGDVAAGAGSVWIATRRGLIQVDPRTMNATWHTDLAPGIKIVHAFGSVWVAGERRVHRVDPTTLDVIATIPVDMPEGIAADRGGIWVSQHHAGTVIRIDPGSNTIAETVTVSVGQGFPMVPSAIDGEIWVALGNTHEVVRIEADRRVTRINVGSQVLSPAVATPEAIWFTNGVDVAITRIDRVTGDVTVAELAPTAVEGLGGIGAGINIGGTLWFPTSGTEMIAIDPITSDVIGTYPLRGSIPRRAVVYHDALWVMSEEGGSLERIALDRLAAD